ncbi:MAG: 1-aminocyclopropane-1-carboxylate deaminase/D-cysteine desulfhydrase, partial [Bacteroidia bacterium]
LKSIGVISGEETSATNATLSEAARLGMTLYFVPRETYRRKEEAGIQQQLKQRFGNFYSIPEGGNNALGIKGCMEILDSSMDYDYICCACGTLATYQGLLQSLKKHQALIGISALKNAHHPGILNDYHFGGYAKHTPALLQFKADFEDEFKIPLDYVYTAKLAYALVDLIQKDRFEKGKKVLMIHSGGLQGNKGYETRYNLKPSR